MSLPGIMEKRLKTLSAVPSDAIGQMRETIGKEASDAECAAFLLSCKMDVAAASAKWTAAKATVAEYGKISIKDVAPFLRAPSTSRKFPDGCFVLLEDMKGGVARDKYGRPICLAIGMQHGSADEMQRQMLYSMQRAAHYTQPGLPPNATSVGEDLTGSELAPLVAAC